MVELADGRGGEAADDVVEVGEGFDAVAKSRASETEQASGGVAADGAANAPLAVETSDHLIAGVEAAAG